jgi:hypothetical protein
MTGSGIDSGYTPSIDMHEMRTLLDTKTVAKA